MRFLPSSRQNLIEPHMLLLSRINILLSSHSLCRRKSSPGPRVSSRISCSPLLSGLTYVKVSFLASFSSFVSSCLSSTSSCVLCYLTYTGSSQWASARAMDRPHSLILFGRMRALLARARLILVILRLTFFILVKSASCSFFSKPPNVPVVFAVVLRHIISSIRFARWRDVINRTYFPTLKNYTVLIAIYPPYKPVDDLLRFLIVLPIFIRRCFHFIMAFSHA